MTFVEERIKPKGVQIQSTKHRLKVNAGLGLLLAYTRAIFRLVATPSAPFVHPRICNQRVAAGLVHKMFPVAGLTGPFDAFCCWELKCCQQWLGEEGHIEHDGSKLKR